MAAADAVRAARAWLLDVGGGYRIAAPAHLVVEYLLAAETMTVPCTPAHCPGVLLWRERLIPVVDLAPVLPASGATSAPWRHAVVLAWQDAPGKPISHGALVVRTLPAETLVTDDMACPLPEDAAVFGFIANACFLHEERPIPVLDVARLFTRPLPATAPGRADKAPATAGYLIDMDVTGAGCPSAPPGESADRPGAERSAVHAQQEE